MTFSQRLDQFCGASERNPIIVPLEIYEKICRMVIHYYPEHWNDPDLPPFLQKERPLVTP